MSSKRSLTCLGEPSEEDIQRTIVDGFTVMGFTVFETSRRGIKCRSCGTKAFGKDGVSKGLPDLVVTHDRWPADLAFLLEVKGPTTKISPEQRLLIDRGRYKVARSWDEAETALLQFMRTVEAISR